MGGGAEIQGQVIVHDTITCTDIAYSSDKNVKNDIHPLDIQDTAKFIYSLIPSEFKFNGHSRKHHGLIAQEVKEAMGTSDWGLFIDKSYDTQDWQSKIYDKNGKCVGIQKNEAQYTLRYTELIADLIATVQSQNERIKQLEKLVVN